MTSSVEYFELKGLRKGGWMDGWVGGWVEGKAGLRIAYSNQKFHVCKIAKQSSLGLKVA